MKKRNDLWLTRLLAIALVALMGGCLTAAQVLTGTITGTVADPTDAVIPGAKVTATDATTGKVWATVSDSQGSFTFTNLPNGFYKVTVEAANFSKFTVPNVQVLLSQTAKVYAKLELSKTGSEVVVTAEQAVVETESAEVKNSFDRKQILNMPLPTRNPLDLVRTLPGIVTPTSSGIADAFVHGLRGNSTNITQDGINVADNFVKTSAFFAISAPTVDAVGEFNVSVGGVGVDGGFGAAQVSIRTARGSNDFHGSAFWFQRTNALNANTWFNNSNGVNATTGLPVSPRPFQLQNRIGINAGGPVYIPGVYEQRDKTFVFGNYEALREPLSRSRTRTVMSQSARTGDFTYVPTCTAATCPAGVTPGVARTVNLLPLGTIGSTGIAPSINAALMAYYNNFVPAPNTDSGCGNGDTVNIRCFQFNLPGRSDQGRWTIRGDHNLTANHSIEFVFNRANFNSNPDLLNGIEPNFPTSPGGAQTSKREVWAWAFHSLFGNSMTNEARFGLQRAPVGFDYPYDFSDTGGFQVTFPGVLTDPVLTSTNLPQGRNTPVRQFSDNFAWVKGAHTYRMGGEWRLVIANSYFHNTVIPRTVLGTNASNSNGIATSDFAGGISSGDLTRAQTVFHAVTGLLSSVGQGFNHTSASSGFQAGIPRTITPIQQNFAFYFQDSWKMRPNLTWNYGARWEYQGVFDDRTGLLLLPAAGEAGFWGPSAVGALFSPSAPVATDTLLDLAGGNNGKPIQNRDLNNIAPFVGFAWDPFKDGKTSIRGASTVHFTSDGFTLLSQASTANAGLFSVLSNNTPTGTFNSASVPTPAIPTAVFPVSQRANFIANTNQALWHFDQNLRTPYVLEWNLSVSRELWNRITVEARYSGNHAVKQFRSFSINELNLLNSPFTFGGNSVVNMLQEFRNAQTNLTLSGNTNFRNAGLAGQLPVPILDALFQGLAPTSGSGFASSGFITNLQQNAIGSFFNTLRTSNTYRVNRETNFPLNFFVANPFANNAIQVTNASWSYYHGFEIELRRRFSSGLFFNLNYTFSKVLTDVNFLTNQTENQNYRSLANTGLDKNRAGFDITHSIAGSFIYPLPFGKGQRFVTGLPGWADRVVGGWQVQGFLRIASGAPFNITSPRLTTGSLTGNTATIRNMTASDLQRFIGVYKRPQGVFWLDPASGLYTINASGSTAATICGATTTTPCFAHPGTMEQGNLPFLGLDAPRFINTDMSVIKRVPIAESMNFEIRLEFFNAFNHPNFGGLTTSIDSSSFGKLTNTVDTVRGGGVTARIIQWAARFNW